MLTRPATKILKVWVGSFLVVAARAGARPVLSLNIKDPKLPDGLESLNLACDYSTEVKGALAGCSLGLKKGLPAKCWLSKAIRGEIGSLRMRAEYVTSPHAANVDATFICDKGTFATRCNSKTGLGPIRWSKLLRVEDRDFAVAVSHDVGKRTGSLAVSTEIAEGTVLDVGLYDSGDVSAVVTHSRSLDEKSATTLVATADMAPLLKEPASAIGTGFASVQLSRLVDRTGKMTVSMNDQKKMLLPKEREGTTVYHCAMHLSYKEFEGGKRRRAGSAVVLPHALSFTDNHYPASHK